MESRPPANLLSIPCELRNVIYLHIFTPEPAYELSTYNEPKDPIAARLKPYYDDDNSRPEPCSPRHLRVLQTCRQIHREAYLLALSLTAFHVVGEAAHPRCFAAQLQMRDTKVTAIRHLMLTAKISHLRALNETWGGYPFGNRSLNLETLTVVPKRPDASYSSYQHVADSAQGHNVSHILSETLKGLKNVRCVVVKNRGCFNGKIWQLVYRSLVYKIWRWGGGKCGLRLQCCSETEEWDGDDWFKVWLMDDCDEGSECGEEVVRIMAQYPGAMPDPALYNL